MAKFINGWQYPKFQIYNSNIIIDTILLPITGTEGMVETVQDRKIVHELLNYSIYNKVYGFTIIWNLPYTEYAKKETMLKIQQILRYHKSGYRIELTPRVDVPRRHFTVVYTGDEIEMGIKRGGANSIGNRLVNISFSTKDLLDDPNWIDPDQIQFIGFRQNNRLNVLET